jgi:signal transduction histidine kinase
VQDNGIGIKSEDLPQLFQPFKKWDDSFNRNYGGTGLGLVITKKLTEGLNGRLEADSVYGKGSVFSVYLPLVTSGEKIKH